MIKKTLLSAFLSVAVPASAQVAPGIHMPTDIGGPYGWLGKAMMAHDAKQVVDLDVM